jgi:hypothetical protein
VITGPEVPRGGRLHHRLAADVRGLGLPDGAPEREPVPQARLAALPAAGQRYLRFVGVPGRGGDWSYEAYVTGRFRPHPGWPWLGCEGWIYACAPQVARVFHMRTEATLLPITSRESYLRGRGTAQGRVFGLVKTADGTGPEHDLSELAALLGEAVLWAPTMLLRLPISWTEVSADAFDLTLHDGGNQVTGRVHLDERGAPVEFSTEDRWCPLPDAFIRTRWTTPVGGWRRAGGRWLPTRTGAVWHLPAGRFQYGDFTCDPENIRHNVSPSDLETHAA